VQLWWAMHAMEDDVVVREEVLIQLDRAAGPWQTYHVVVVVVVAVVVDKGNADALTDPLNLHLHLSWEHVF
jgi:hypothetical protein